MTIDFHYHTVPHVLQYSTSAAMPRGCILAQKESDNVSYLRIAARNGIACGLFAHPRGSGWSRIVELSSKRKVLAYLHFELIDETDEELLNPMLLNSQEHGVPIVVHLSRHDQYSFSELDAIRCLENVLQRFPDLRVIVSHCGGENVLAVIKAAKNCPRVLLDTSRITETSERSFHRNAVTLLDRIAADIPLNNCCTAATRIGRSILMIRLTFSTCPRSLRGQILMTFAR